MNKCQRCGGEVVHLGEKYLKLRYVEIVDYAGRVIERMWLCIRCRRERRRQGLGIRMVI